MDNIAYFGSDVLNVQQASELQTDSKGYRLVTLSAFNYSNRGDGRAYYKFTRELENLFKASSQLMTRARERNLYGEWGHPTLQPGESVQSFVNRFRTITEKHMSHHIKDIVLKHAKDHEGNDVVLAMGWVKPFGPYASCLESAFGNDEQNCSFSIRSASKRHERKGPDGNMRLEKEIHTIFTWDYVNLPGVDLCTKYNSPAQFDTEGYVDNAGMDSLLELEFSIEDLNAAAAVADHLSSLTGIEDSKAVSTTMIKDELGWNKVELLSLHATDLF
ncbi:virion structural protein [Vibrio phage C-ZP2022]|nr:virion structural protein [Vibrio phage C-ZP2022]